MSPQVPQQPAAATKRALPRGVAFWLVAAMTAILLAASSAPSPLYPVYQSEFGFSAITLTAIFAVYVLALLLSLLTVGRLSDFVGRRPVLIVALIVEAGAMAVFFAADGVTALWSSPGSFKDSRPVLRSGCSARTCSTCSRAASRGSGR